MTGKMRAILSVALVVACAALLFRSVTYVFPGPAVSERQPQLIQGERLPAIGRVDFAAAPNTVVLILSTHCPYCTRSMPLYVRLARSAALKRKTVQIVVVGKESEAALSNNIEHYTLRVNRIARLSESLSASIEGTPTVLIVGADRVIRESFVGELDEASELRLLGFFDS